MTGLRLNNTPMLTKRTPIDRSGASHLGPAGAKCPAPSASHGPNRDGFATVVEYVLLIAVGSLLAAITLLVVEQGLVSLVKRVGELLGPTL